MSWEPVLAAIRAATGEPFGAPAVRPVGGGCINQAWTLDDGRRRWFVKTNEPAALSMFEAEAEGLAAIAATDTLRVPQPVCTGAAQGRAFLVLEYLPLTGRGGAETLGRQLAALHGCTAARHGWHRDNTLGTTPQPNGQEADWVRFWGERRLGHQLRLAETRGGGAGLRRKGERLLERLPALFTDHRPPPSLLHGDLWGGNWAVTADGTPVIFDPAVYYGDRETDLAMTELFGGFPPAFYDAYREAWPLAPGYPMRKTLYNLYHVLNHFNLFGGGYGHQAEGMMEQLLSELS